MHRLVGFAEVARAPAVLENDERRDVEALQHKLNVCGRVYSRHDLGRVHRAELLTRRMEVQSRLDELHQLIMSAARAANSDEVYLQCMHRGKPTLVVLSSPDRALVNEWRDVLSTL